MGFFDWLLKDDKSERSKRVFISFSMKDSEYRDHIVSQAKNQKSRFKFIDMSVKKQWKEVEWKRKCRTKIKKSDAVIVLLSKNTWQIGRAHV